MMKKFILALVCLIAAPALRAQVTVTGNLKDAGVTNITGANSFVRFTLTGFGNNIPKVNGQNLIGRAYFDFHPDANGNIAGPLQGNDTISPIGSLYQVCIYDNGTQFKCNNYSITGTAFNLNSATPIVVGPNNSTGFISAPRMIEFVQGSPSTTWTITHNFGDRNVLFNCYDTNNKYLIPDTVVESSITVLTITFTSAQAGSCVVMTAQTVSLTNAPANALLTNAPSGQVVTTSPFTIQTQFNATGGGSLSGGIVVANNVFANMHCDGSTDDTGLIQAAIAAAPSAVPTRVVMPPGTCRITGTVQVPDNVWLQGAGTRATVIQRPSATNTATDLFDISGSTGNAIFSDFTIDGSGSTQTTGAYNIGLTSSAKASGTNGLTITRMHFKGGYVGAIGLATNNGVFNKNVAIQNNEFDNNGQFIQSDCVTGDMTITNPQGVRVEGNRSEAAHSNFVCFNPQAAGSGDVIVTNNVVRNATGFGTALGGNGVGAVISNNIFDTPTNQGNVIDVATWTDSSVSGNYIVMGNACTAACSGVGDLPPANHVSISDNQIIGPGAVGTPDNTSCVSIGGSDIIISHNQCRNSGAGGITTGVGGSTNAAHWVIEGNVTKNNSQKNGGVHGGIELFVNSGGTLSDVLVRGNHSYTDATSSPASTQGYGLAIAVFGSITGISNLVVEDNDFRGNSVSAIGSNETAPATGWVFRNNLGLNPVGGLIAPAIPSSGSAYTNASGFDCVVYVSAGSTADVAVQIGGTTITAVTLTHGVATPQPFILPANQTITLTYAGGGTSAAWQWFAN